MSPAMEDLECEMRRTGWPELHRIKPFLQGQEGQKGREVQGAPQGVLVVTDDMRAGLHLFAVHWSRDNPTR